MNYDKDMKVGDLVKVTLSSVRGEYDNGIVLGIIKDNTYKDIDRYYVQYYSFGIATPCLPRQECIPRQHEDSRIRCDRTHGIHHVLDCLQQGSA